MTTKLKNNAAPRQAEHVHKSVRVLIPRERIKKRIKQLAHEIRRDFGDQPLHLVGVLKGAVFFLADLARQIKYIEGWCIIHIKRIPLGLKTRYDIVPGSTRSAGGKARSGAVGS